MCSAPDEPSTPTPNGAEQRRVAERPRVPMPLGISESLWLVSQQQGHTFSHSFTQLSLFDFTGILDWSFEASSHINTLLWTMLV